MVTCKDLILKSLCTTYRFRTGPGNPGKPWNFIVHFPELESPGKLMQVLESPGNL